MNKDFKDAGVKVLHKITYADGADYLLDRGDMLFLVDGKYLAKKLLKDRQAIKGLVLVTPQGKPPYLRAADDANFAVTAAENFCFSPMRLEGKRRLEFYKGDEFRKLYQSLLKKYGSRRGLKGIRLEVGFEVPNI